MFGQIRFGHTWSQIGRNRRVPQTRLAKPKGMLGNEFARIPRTLGQATRWCPDVKMRTVLPAQSLLLRRVSIVA